MGDFKYCCLDKNLKSNEKQCAPINTNVKLNKKLAIFTLIFGGDSYLPGVLLLGSSIRKSNPVNAKKISLCCMVTKDVSKTARDIISKVYDRVIDVEYLQIDPDLIRHKNKETRIIYSKTFTKLRCLEFIEYEKILFLDADTLVLKDEIFSLFNLNTPACVFMGGNIISRDYFKSKKDFNLFQKQFCNYNNKQLHGNLIPYNKNVNEKTTGGLNIETSLILLKPDIRLVNERDKFLKIIESKNIKIAADTEMISRMFKNKIYAIEPRFFGRWQNPNEHKELVLLDLYGFLGKPWNINVMKDLITWPDVVFWWMMYAEIYYKEYKYYKNEILDKLYDKINKIVNKQE